MRLSTKTTRARGGRLKGMGDRAILRATGAARRYNLRLGFAVDLLNR
jgi:hypothetical protein